MDFFQNTCFKKRSNMAVTPNLWVTISLYKTECLPVITQNKKYSSKQAVSMIYTLGKELGKLFKVSEMFLFRQSKEVRSILWSVSISVLCISREERTKQIVFMGKRFSFAYVDIYSNVPKGKYILKNNSLESQLCFHLFLWQTQK